MPQMWQGAMHTGPQTNLCTLWRFGMKRMLWAKWCLFFYGALEFMQQYPQWNLKVFNKQGVVPVQSEIDSKSALLRWVGSWLTWIIFVVNNPIHTSSHSHLFIHRLLHVHVQYVWKGLMSVNWRRSQGGLVDRAVNAVVSKPSQFAEFASLSCVWLGSFPHPESKNMH